MSNKTEMEFELDLNKHQKTKNLTDTSQGKGITENGNLYYITEDKKIVFYDGDGAILTYNDLIDMQKELQAYEKS